MNINKRTASALKKGMMLRKFSYQKIGDECGGISREAVRQWVENRRIPDKHVFTVFEITGIEIR